jgi:hypothetical protein
VKVLSEETLHGSPLLRSKVTALPFLFRGFPSIFLSIFCPIFFWRKQSCPDGGHCPCLCLLAACASAPRATAVPRCPSTCSAGAGPEPRAHLAERPHLPPAPVEQLAAGKTAARPNNNAVDRQALHYFTCSLNTPRRTLHDGLGISRHTLHDDLSILRRILRVASILAASKHGASKQGASNK